MFEFETNTAERHHVIEAPNNNKIHLKRHDPYGFWKLSLEKGQLPEEFKGLYTTIDEARRAANAWLSRKIA